MIINKQFSMSFFIEKKSNFFSELIKSTKTINLNKIKLII